MGGVVLNEVDSYTSYIRVLCGKFNKKFYINHCSSKALSSLKRKIYFFQFE